MIPRRELFASAAALGLGATLLGTAGLTTADAFTIAKIPARRASYGPNGTHWPANTPKSGHATVLRVACTWAAIGRAIAGVTASQAAGGVLIRVANGTLPGGTVLQNLGSASWSKNVLVTPENGWGTVTIRDTATIRNVRGVTFARLNAHHIRLIDCSRTNWAQSKLTLGMRTYAESTAVTQCNSYEVVMPVSKADPTDPFSYAASRGGSISNCLWEGCYGAAVFRPVGSSAHLDTFQMFGDGSYRGLTIRDSIFFGGNNCGLQIGGSSTADPARGTDFLVLDHSMVLSQAMSVRTRYKLPSGASGGGSQAINGAGEPWQLSAINSSYVLGSMHVTQWKRIADSYTSHSRAVTGNPARTGRWAYQSSLESLSASQLDSMSPTPTDAYLSSIWK